MGESRAKSGAADRRRVKDRSIGGSDGRMIRLSFKIKLFNTRQGSAGQTLFVYSKKGLAQLVVSDCMGLRSEQLGGQGAGINYTCIYSVRTVLKQARGNPERPPNDKSAELSVFN
ncbi:hypothetical protein TEQG_04482 [Trichophyton equinum CBS 127.97]|uniref:Uncharacterized protein n=1 Tax=Trichophyton equinum (strain ATCC MYA-4606 / CBS 127.97) TaxID=559882 RepID=F2PUA3_TRIEC|nr:hypothetical protein TEQG_04482 [Trichophyton equinum CBS 127.97]